jgi:hypothetical protein
LELTWEEPTPYEGHATAVGGGAGRGQFDDQDPEQSGIWGPIYIVNLQVSQTLA